MKSQISKILIENGLDPYDYDLQELYDAGKKNLVEHIELYYDKDFTCSSVINSLFTDGILYHIKRKGKSKTDILIEEKTKDILEQNKKISEKSKEITQSIEYAKSLQSAILPSISKINQFLKNYFIIYKPKDIIGGDFYWFESYENYIYFAVADCTGHGVPGGMVSLIASSALNKSFENSKNTSEILNNSRDIIIDTFNKNEREVYDGMDIIICRYDIINRTLQYSGANRPLWILSSVTGEIKEYKTDRFPVGKFFEKKPFSQNELLLEGKDIVYLFSDGVIDQFGHSDLGKFKTSRLRNLILKIRDFHITTQKEILESEIHNWKLDTEQTDDISIWGIQL
jgi:serine phosphatase RsbU (regulator of sigma subunit)